MRHAAARTTASCRRHRSRRASDSITTNGGMLSCAAFPRCLYPPIGVESARPFPIELRPDAGVTSLPPRHQQPAVAEWVYCGDCCACTQARPWSKRAMAVCRKWFCQNTAKRVDSIHTHRNQCVKGCDSGTARRYKGTRIHVQSVECNAATTVERAHTEPEERAISTRAACEEVPCPMKTAKCTLRLPDYGLSPPLPPPELNCFYMYLAPGHQQDDRAHPRAG